MNDSERPLAIKKIVEVGMQQYPTIWRRLCPRIYRGVDRFHDYRYPAAMRLTSYIFHTEQPEVVERLPEEFAHISICASAQELYNYPLYFMERDLLDALVHTDLRDELDWAKMPFPYPSFTVMLPRNSFYCDGQEIAYFEFFRILKGERYGTANGEYEAPQDCLWLTAYRTSGNALWHKLHAPYNPATNRSDIKDSPLNQAESKSLDELVQVLFNCLFIMAARPEYVETGHRIGQTKKRTELWTPNLIGRKYAIKRDPNAETGTHASPRMHWRRGHFRQQAYGVGRTEHKIIWLEPVLVNAKVMEAHG